MKSSPAVFPESEASKILKRLLARGAISAAGINIATTGLAFLAQVVLARALGADGYGVFAYVTAWVTVLVLLATLGFPTGLLRFAAAYRAREEWHLLRGVIRYAELRVAAASFP
jgi:O-antigen/teichoic acid export membrane protein